MAMTDEELLTQAIAQLKLISTKIEEIAKELKPAATTKTA